MMTAAQALGALGERIAARWLEQRGWMVVERRFTAGHRDVDLIVRRDGVLAFVEVKTRRSAAFGGPVGAVGWRKQRHLAHAARLWLARSPGLAVDVRFDVVGVVVQRAGVRVCHVENAFPLPTS